MKYILEPNETMDDVVKKLKASFDTVRSIAPIAYWYENLNANGRIKDIHFSDEMRRMLGYKSKEEFPDELNTLMTFTHPEDVQVMLQGAIDAGTGKSDRYDVQCRIRKADGSYLWCNVTGKLVKDCHGTTVGMYGAFIDISSEVKLNEEQENERRRREVINGFSKEYDAAFYGNISDNTYKKLTNVDAVEKKVERITSADVAMRSYVVNFVHPDDAGLFEGEFIDLRVAEKNVPVGEVKTFEYRSRSGGDYAWYKAMLRRITSNEVLIGFKNCDKEIVARIVSDKVIGDFASVFVVNLKNDTYRFISRNRDSGFADVPGGVYTETMKEYISRVNPDYREHWGNMLDLENVREMLTQNSRLEYVYPLENAKKRWRRCIVEKFETENGVPTSFVMTYYVLDDASAENYELTGRLAEQKKQLEAQQAELQQVNMRNQMLYKISNAMKWSYEISADGQLVSYSYSDQAVEILPADDFESSPMAWIELIHPDDRDAVVKAFEAAVHDRTGETPYDIAYRIKTHGGNYIWLKVTGRVHWREDGTGEMFGVNIDITNQMEEQQRHLLGAVPISPDILAKENIGMWAFELDEGEPPRMYGDAAMLRLVGLEHQVPPEEMYHAWYDHIASGSYALVQDAVSKMIAGEHAEVQYPWHHPNGTMMIVRCGGVRNPEYTKGIRVEGTHQNVTEVLHFNEEQIRLRRRMNMVYSLSDEYAAIMIVDPQTGEYDWYESKAQEIEELTAMSVHGTDFYKDIGVDIVSIIHDDDKEQFKAVYNKANLMKIAESGEMQETENRWKVGADGTYLWKYNKLVRMTDENGTVFVVVGVIDTTEAKKKEEAINAQKKLLEQQQALSDGLAREYHTVWLVEGYGEHRLHLFRSTGKKTVQRAVQRGLDEPTYDGTMVKYVMDSVHEDDRARVLDASRFDTVIRETPEIGTYVVSYKRYCDDAGNVDYHQMCFAKAVAEDGTVNYILAFRDADQMLREQIAQQQQLAEALSMAESANRAKTTFLNNMSHDIRTPMNAIIGFTGLAASHIDNKEQVQDYLTKIGQSSDHLLSLINDVLDMSRIESGKMNLEEKEENLPAIIHTLRDIVQADIRAKQHDFFIDTVNVNEEDIICDKLRLNQVLLNILSNAIKYTANGGIISLRITEKAVKPSGYATYEFCIKDNGMGMDEEYLKTIFDPFTRVKSSTVSGIQGTGLGMAITKNIIDMMGGTIDIKSALGKGTQMTVTFDFKLQAAPKEAVFIPELKGLRGLVVDDDADTCMSLTCMLRDIGMRDEWCVTGKEAVLRAAEAYRIGDSFKVYIIDWLMPDMNGIETTRRIRKVIGDEAPIIILTAYDWSDIEDEAREAGVTAFVSKPMFPSDLRHVLNNCLGNAEETVPVEADAFDFTGKKILLVEDNALNREIAVELLTEYGCITDTAEDGTIAVEKVKHAKAGDYDVILMDIQMPIMNGYEATKAIRALGTPISKIPILAMTADAFAEDRKHALEVGMNDHITKPINITLLRQTLAKYI